MEGKMFLITLLLTFCYVQGNGGNAYYYPCGTDCIDINCVRDFLLKTGQCTAVSHCDGDPIIEPHQIAYIPNLNITIDCNDVTTAYYGSKILAFYLDVITNILLISVDFTGLLMDSPRCVMELARKGIKPLVVVDYINVTYAATITAYTKWGSGISLKDVKVSSYNTQPFPKFDIGPNVTESPDPVVQRALHELLADEPTAVQELFLTKGYYYFFGWMQNYVCDYGYHYSGAVNK